MIIKKYENGKFEEQGYACPISKVNNPDNNCNVNKLFREATKAIGKKVIRYQAVAPYTFLFETEDGDFYLGGE